MTGSRTNTPFLWILVCSLGLVGVGCRDLSNSGDPTDAKDADTHDVSDGGSEGSPCARFGLVAHWTFDREWITSNLGTTPIADETGNGSTAYLMHGERVAGKIGPWAAMFNGRTAYASAPLRQKAVTSSTALSVAAWLNVRRPQDVPTRIWAQFLGRRFGPAERDLWYLAARIDPASSAIPLSFGVQMRSGAEPFATFMFGDLDLNRWRHLVGRYDGDEVRVFVDGQSSKAVVALGGMPEGSADAPLVMGAGDNGTNGGVREFANIDLDDVRIYDCALSDADISTLASRQ